MIEWIRDGVLWFVKTFLALSFISAISMVIFEIMRKINGDRMMDRVYWVQGRDTGVVWSVLIRSNDSSMSEEDALSDFRKFHHEAGFIVSVTELEDDNA